FATGLLPGFELVPDAVTSQHGILIVVQALTFASQFLVLFLLQKTGGPVLLSLLGSVGAIVAVPAAILILGENAPKGLYPAVGLITLGVVLLNIRRR
ncbi:MAG: EamA/RhaT family transporter, partial [Pseudomonadota bacterium]